MRAQRRTREKGVGRARMRVGVKNLDTGGAPVIEFRRAFPFKRYPDEDAEAEGWPVSWARKTLPAKKAGHAARPLLISRAAQTAAAADSECCNAFPNSEHLAQGEKV